MVNQSMEHRGLESGHAAGNRREDRRGAKGGSGGLTMTVTQAQQAYETKRPKVRSLAFVASVA
jgi:hypothetical protein